MMILLTKMTLIRALTTMITEQQIIENAERIKAERESLILDYYISKLRRELELGIINIHTFPAFFFIDQKASNFKSRITTALFGKEKAVHLGLYDPYEGEEEEDYDNLTQEEIELFFGEEGEGDIPVMLSPLTNNSGILNSN